MALLAGRTVLFILRKTPAEERFEKLHLLDVAIVAGLQPLELIGCEVVVLG